MEHARKFSAAAVVVFLFSACSDAPERALTGPNLPSFSYLTMDPAAKLQVEEAVRGGIRCLLVDSKQETNRLNDWNSIIDKASKGAVTEQSVKDWVNNFVKWANDLISSKKTLLPTSADCGGRDPAPSLQIAAQEVYNLMYLYSGQYDKFVAPDYSGYEGSEDQQTALCINTTDCELEGEGAYLFVPEGTFDVPVIITFQRSDQDPSVFAPAGQQVGPVYDFSWTPAVTAKGEGVGRFVCVSLEDYDAPGSLQLFRYANGELFGIPNQTPDFICPDHVAAATRGGFWKQFASRLLRPLTPKPLYASRHAAIGGPDVAASPHSVVRLEEESPSAVEDVLVLGDVNMINNSFGPSFNADNGQFLRNVFAYGARGTRWQEAGVLFHRGHASSCTDPSDTYCAPAQMSAAYQVLTGAGAVIYDVEDRSATIGPIPSNIRVLFLLAPTTSLASSEIENLRHFASEGGLIVLVNDFYPNAARSVQNQILEQLGSALRNTGGSFACSQTLPAGALAAHALTDGMNSISIACGTGFNPGTGDTPIVTSTTENDPATGASARLVSLGRISFTTPGPVIASRNRVLSEAPAETELAGRGGLPEAK